MLDVTGSEHPVYLMLPFAIIDDLLPNLKDTEIRLLLVCLRQTWGRMDRFGNERTSDWLSHGQLKARTGRASEAVSGAIDALVRRGLLRVADEHGRSLDTAALRMQAHGRLLFSPGPVVMALRAEDGLSKTEIGKPKLTDRGINYSQFRKSNYEDSENEIEGGSPSREEVKIAIRDRLARLSEPYSRTPARD